MLFLVILLKCLCEEKLATVYYHQGNYQVVDDKYDVENGLCFGKFDDSYYDKGWDILKISTTMKSSLYSDEQIFYCSGLLEGYLTSQRIYMFYESMSVLAFFQTNGTMSQAAKSFLTDQMNWVKSQDLKDDYWKFVYSSFSHLDGILNGYNSNIGEKMKKLEYWDIYLLYSMGDMMDILKLPSSDFFNEGLSLFGKNLPKYATIGPHCSAFISKESSSGNIYFAHTTWALFSMMVRIFKSIEINLNNPLAKSSGVYFSSYPGAVGSSDDFYITSSELFVSETTLSCFNDSLSKLISPKSLLYWQRTLLSNRLSSTPKDWVNYFSQHNSGTYNNEWMVLDAGKYYKNVKNNDKTDTSNLLYVLDQIPGFVDTFDLSDSLVSNSYFPSYNLPYSKKVYDICEISQQIKKHPDQNSSLDYDHCARANIFRRDAVKVSSMEDAKDLIRHNSYIQDPLTLHDPSLTVSSRTDLEVNNAFCSGGIDGKVVSITDWMENKKLWIVSGPSSDNVPIFEYDKAPKICSEMPFIKYVGQPNVWNFPWVEINVEE